MWSKFFGFFTLCFSFLGCASTKIYPVCYYDSNETQANREDISKFVTSVAGDSALISFSPNDRYISVETFDSKHQTLAQVWPRVGCIGQTRYDVEYLKYAACIYMIQDAIQNGGLTKIGKVSDSILDTANFYCGLPLLKPTS